jgi:PAS domain S-box-containing protein
VYNLITSDEKSRYKKIQGISDMLKSGSRFPIQKAVFIIFIILIISLSWLNYDIIDNERESMTNSLIDQKVALTDTIAMSIESAEVHLVPAYKVQVVKEVGTHEDVVYCRIVKPTGEIYITSNDNEWGMTINNPALFTTKTIVIDDVYNGENIKAVVSPTYRSYTVWVGFSLKNVDIAIRNAIISIAGIFIGIIALAVMVFFGLSFVNRELKKTKEYTENIVTSMADALFILGPDGRISNVNKAAVDLLGYDESEFVGKPVNMIFKKAEEGEEETAGLFDGAGLERLQKTGSFRDVTQTCLTKDGNSVPMSISGAVMKDDKGKLQGFVFIGKDIAERRRAEKALKESEEKYRGFFRTSRDCVFITSKDGRWIDLNDAAVELFGYSSREELMQAKIPDLYASPEARAKHISIIAERGSTKDFPVDLRRKDGSVIHTLITSVARYDAEGNATGFQGTIRDITEHKRAEEALRQVNKKLNLLSSITRHDILNQLMALKGYLELSKRHTNDAVLVKYIEKEEEAAETIHQQVSFTKDYQDIGIRSPQWHDVKNLIIQAINTINPGTVAVSADLGKIEIYADPLVKKVFYTLVENALRHGEKVTKISFSSRESDDGLTLICEDDGMGIPRNEKENIFTRKYFKNTGFGLFLTREILSITGLTIMENGEPGKGAHFEIHVPKGMYRFTGTV